MDRNAHIWEAHLVLAPDALPLGLRQRLHPAHLDKLAEEACVHVRVFNIGSDGENGLNVPLMA